jgi:arylsulfatase A-like enzyme
MNADSAQSISRTGLLQRRRALQAELVSAPWALGAGFGLAVASITLLGRAMMLVAAIWRGFLRGISPLHAIWLAPELAHDLIVLGCISALLGALLRGLPARWRPVAIGLGYLVVILASLVVIVSVPVYGGLQTTLQLTQLLLAGGIRDLVESGLGIVPVGVFIAAFTLLIAACFFVPWFGAFARRHMPWLHSGRRVGALLLAIAALLAAGWLAPEEGAQRLQMSPVYEFMASVARFGLRRRPPKVDMRSAPHFDASLMFGTPPKAVPTETLVDVTKLPLQRPNVVLVVLESASMRLTGLWNGRPQDTPRLLEMSKHGLAFDQYYTASPVSMKSLFALTCSSYPHTVPQAETYTNPSIDCLSISELLKDRGYRTGLFHGGRFSYTRKDAYFRQRRYDVMRDAAVLKHRSQYATVPWGVDDRAVIDDAIDWLEEGNAQAPFFLNVIFLAPHEPYVVNDSPEPFGKKTDVNRYRNATLFVDSQVGRLWDWVTAHGKADNTLFVIVGDHGEAFGEHPGDFLHGGRIYDTAVRTPLLLVNPRLFAGQRSDRVGNHVDLVPTVLDLLGIPKPPRHQGASLLRGYQPHMIYFYADWQRHYLGLRDGQWKYIYNVDRERHELFDLTQDQVEQTNLAYRYPAQVEAYAKRVRNWEGFYQELIPNYERYVNGQDSCAGKGTCYLDELKPVLQHGLMRRNRSGSGFKLQLGNQVFEHGLGVAPLSILRFNIRGDGFRKLKGGVGHHAQGGPANLSLKVSTEIYLDDKLIWSSGKLTADDPPSMFELDVDDGAILELIGYDVDAEDWRDYIDWVDVRLER